MAIAYLVPLTQISLSLWRVGGGSAVGATNVWDADASYVETRDAFARTFTCYTTQLPGDAGSVSACINYVWHRYTNGSGGVAYPHIGSGWGGALGTQSYWATIASRAHGNPLTVAGINGDVAGCQLYRTAGSSWIRCSYIRRDVTYEVGGGANFFQIYNWVGPMLFGASLMARDIVNAAAYSAARIMPKTTSVRFTDEEIATFWRSWKDKDYKFPSYFFLSGKSAFPDPAQITGPPQTVFSLKEFSHGSI